MVWPKLFVGRWRLLLSELLGGLGHLGGAFELIPGEGLAVDDNRGEKNMFEKM